MQRYCSIANSVNYVAYLTPIFIIQLIIQLSDTVRIPIFWLADLHLMIQGCDGTTSLMSLSWDSRGCHYTMASADSKFHDLSDADIDSPIDDAIPKNTKKATAWEISVLKVTLRILNFLLNLVEVFLRVVNRLASFGGFNAVFLCAVYVIWIIKMSWLVIINDIVINGSVSPFTPVGNWTTKSDTSQKF